MTQPRQTEPDTEFDQYHLSYSEMVNHALAPFGQGVDAFTRAKAEDLLALIKERFPDPSQVKVLDVGCGVGNYHPLLKPTVGQLTGIDVSTACVERAARDNPEVRYDTYDGQALPYPDNSYSLAFAVCVMHHVPPAEWRGFLGEMLRVIVPGGTIVIYEHNPWNPLTRYVVSNCEFDRAAVLLSTFQLRRLAREAGGLDVEVRSLLTVPPGAGVLALLNRLASRLPLGTQYRVSCRK